MRANTLKVISNSQVDAKLKKVKRKKVEKTMNLKASRLSNTQRKAKLFELRDIPNSEYNIVEKSTKKVMKKSIKKVTRSSKKLVVSSNKELSKYSNAKFKSNYA